VPRKLVAVSGPEKGKRKPESRAHNTGMANPPPLGNMLVQVTPSIAMQFDLSQSRRSRRRMSVVGGRAEKICSQRAFRLLTRNGHIGLSKAMALAHTGVCQDMEAPFWFCVSAALIHRRRCALSNIDSYFQHTYRDFVESSVACIGVLLTGACRAVLLQQIHNGGIYETS